MKQFKVIQSIVIIMVCVILMAVTESKAEGEEPEEYTQEKAVEFALSLVGQQINVDREGYDCVDIAKLYFKEVGGKEYVSVGYAYNYARSVSDAAIPDGWVRKKCSEGYHPQPGDVAVWEANQGIAKSAGHVAVVVEVIGDKMIVIDQDTNEQRAAKCSEISVDNATCFIVPTFNQIKRYIVLVLDVSGAQTFEEPPSWMSLYGYEYTSDSSIEAVKEAAQVFLDDAEKAIEKNAIAIVTYSEEAQVAVPFTTDFNKMRNALDAIERVEESNRSIYAGMQCAYELLKNVGNDKTKSVVLCTTGLTDCGEYNYEGRYGEDTVASNWQNSGTEIRLYAYANKAIESSDAIKSLGATVYVIGVFDPIEANIPSLSSIHDVAHFLRQTASDLASSEDTMFEVNDATDLEFVFGELREEVIGNTPVNIFIYPDIEKEYIDRDNINWDGGSLDKGGRYETVLWGPSLFETPSTELFRSSITDKESVNYNLALLCGSLCAASYDKDYIRQAYYDLGVDAADYYQYNYGDDEHAFSIGGRWMKINEENTYVIIVTLRGTDSWNERIGDAYMSPRKWDLDNRFVWDYIDDFRIKVLKELKNYLVVSGPFPDNTKVKLLITGHSLGGGAANLLAASLDHSIDGVLADGAANLSKDDIYVYTFGALDGISAVDDQGKAVTDVPVSDGYENIINIYNLLDTFSPYASLSPDFKTSYAQLRMKTKLGLLGKYGQFYFFSNDMRFYVPDNCTYSTHAMGGYIQALKNYLLEGMTSGSKKVRVTICCPVDVEVRYENETLCIIKDNLVVYCNPGVGVFVENGEKTIVLSSGMQYQILITATDDGVMEYSVQSIDFNNPESSEFVNIALEPGKVMEGTIIDNATERIIELFTLDENGERATVIQQDGNEVVIPKETTVTVTPIISATPIPTITPTITSMLTPTMSPTVTPMLLPSEAAEEEKSDVSDRFWTRGGIILIIVIIVAVFFLVKIDVHLIRRKKGE